MTRKEADRVLMEVNRFFAGMERDRRLAEVEDDDDPPGGGGGYYGTEIGDGDYESAWEELEAFWKTCPTLKRLIERATRRRVS